MSDSQVSASVLFYYEMKLRVLLNTNTNNCIFFVLIYSCTTAGSSLLSVSKVSANTFSLVVREYFGILILISCFVINR